MLGVMHLLLFVLTSRGESQSWSEVDPNRRNDIDNVNDIKWMALARENITQMQTNGKFENDLNELK